MRAFYQSSRTFWSVALVATALVLGGSVELGKVIGATLVARGGAETNAVPNLTIATPPEVVGGQVHAAAALGQTSPIWPDANRRPTAAKAKPGQPNPARLPTPNER